MQNTIEQDFLQSPEWEKFQKSLGGETFRIDESLFVVHKLPIVGKYAYCPRGPVSGIVDVFKEVKKRGCGWIRIEPNTEKELKNTQESILDFSADCFRAPHDVQPREILIMDISKQKEILLAEMKAKTRYNIRLAEKKGVKVVISSDQQYQKRFIELVQETARRAGIRPHAQEHYTKMFESLGEHARLYSAEYEGDVIASNMMVFLEDGAIYLHGGSSNEYRNVMAPFLLQWQAICDAKKNGCNWYDFGGVDTDQQPTTSHKKQNWLGITRFKQGFCPETESIQFPGTYDIVLSSTKYSMYRMLTQLKKVLKK